MSHRKRERERLEQQALDRQRSRVISGIHAGHLHAGDRLPGFREIAAQSGVDLRAVGRIYSTLAREGLVEIRGKTGVYVAHQERIGGAVLAETARWTTSVLREAWQRRIALPDYREFLRRCISNTAIRCACIESTEDQLFTLGTELARDFGLLTTPVHADSLGASTGDALPPALHDADLLATTAFHAASLRPLADSLGKPLVVIRLDPDFSARVEQQLQRGHITLICVDPRFIDRFCGVFAPDAPERVHAILADDARALDRLNPERPLIVTNAASHRLQSRSLPRSIHPQGARIISSESAAELIDQIVRINLEAASDAHGSTIAASGAWPAGQNLPAPRATVSA